MLTAQVRALSDEVDRLRERVASHPHDIAMLERRLADARQDARTTAANNERLAATLREARDQIVSLKSEVDRLAQPPASFGVFLASAEDHTADIYTSGRKMRVSVSPDVDMRGPGARPRGDGQRGDERGRRAASSTRSARWCCSRRCSRTATAPWWSGTATRRASSGWPTGCASTNLRSGDSLLIDRRVHFAYERVPKLDVEELVLEEVPDIDYTVIGGLSSQIEAIRDAVELPFLHKDLFDEHELKAPKGILLYGPPGCGKTLIAKAVANSLAKKVSERTGEEGRSFFLNIKGPELLNKYVGETERHIRLVFQRARDKASDGMPVIVFFDEMDSLFRTRGSGVSSDVENTIVPQLLSEIDGVEGLDNVIIIGASNREDMIDPAILRPGRLDVKIKIERPDAEAAREIFSKYLTPTLPLHAGGSGRVRSGPATRASRA